MRATVFGGSGFIGRYVVERLADRGAVVRVAVRDPAGAQFLKPAGNVGQIAPMRVSVSDQETVAAAVDGADWVINLVGILYESGAATFDAIHVEGARNVAEAARRAGARRLVHMSALGADKDSPAHYARSKAAGEEAVRAAFPDATIIRPSVVFGPEDDFFNRFAAIARLSPVLPVVGAMPRRSSSDGGNGKFELLGDGGPRFQPVYVGDVADAIVAALERDDAKGRTYELGGPRVYTMREIMETILRVTNRRRFLVPLPLALADLQAAVLEKLPVPPLTRDQVRLLGRDNVLAGEAPTLGDLGIAPTPVEGVVETYLDKYRAGGRFTRPARR